MSAMPAVIPITSLRMVIPPCCDAEKLEQQNGRIRTRIKYKNLRPREAGDLMMMAHVARVFAPFAAAAAADDDAADAHAASLKLRSISS